jgi:hypothetical protein
MTPVFIADFTLREKMIIENRVKNQKYPERG